MLRRSVISPALSDEEEDELRRRTEMSPSPEVDLSSHELDGDDAADDDLVTSTTTSLISRERTRSPVGVQHSATTSAPLEGDEREFSQSALYIERRSALRENSASTSSASTPSPTDISDENGSKRQREEDYESENGNSEELLGYPPLSASPALMTPVKRPRGDDERTPGPRLIWQRRLRPVPGVHGP